jgi:hypothetical protein
LGFGRRRSLPRSLSPMAFRAEELWNPARVLVGNVEAALDRAILMRDDIFGAPTVGSDLVVNWRILK